VLIGEPDDRVGIETEPTIGIVRHFYYFSGRPVAVPGAIDLPSEEKQPCDQE
jgi:hypothetical protein